MNQPDPLNQKVNELTVSFVARRRKEYLAFMIVRFMKAYAEFRSIHSDFKKITCDDGSFEDSNLFSRIKKLEENIVFDIKEKAHFLFRNQGNIDDNDTLEDKYTSLKKLLQSIESSSTKTTKAKEILSDFRRSIVNRSIDSCVGTGFHLFMILREALYQLEFYVPQFVQEHVLLDRITALAQTAGYEFSTEEEHELEHLKQLDKLNQTITTDIKEHALRAAEQCNSLFKETAEVLRHFIEESPHNEVLVLNLLRENELVEITYGEGALERVFVEMYKSIEIPGTTGIEKAINYLKKYSVNTSSLKDYA